MILDEIHHGGDALSWGDAVREAFEPAARRLALTGTPFRSDTSPIPFVTVRGRDATASAARAADYTYGYGEALRDGVVRPVIFLAYSGQMRWRTRAGDEVAARLGEPLTKDMTGAGVAHRARPARASGSRRCCAAADQRLTEVRRGVPDAGGLVIATDQDAARAYAAMLRRGHRRGRRRRALRRRRPRPTGSRSSPTGRQRWMVAVRMVSEGVDVPRLAVGVYATSTSTPLFFAQAVGPLRPGPAARRDGVGLPAHASRCCSSSPAELEVERDHALDRPSRDGEDRVDARGRAARGGQPRRTRRPDEPDGRGFEALESQATFDRVLFDGEEFGTEADGRQRRGAGLPRASRACSSPTR